MPYQLFIEADKLVLKFKSFSPLSADFNSSAWQKRKAAGKNQGLIRAVKPRQGLRIVDATAGWGRDAALLASFGAKVLMVERNPMMAALLEDALSRRDEYSKLHLDLNLVKADALDYLSGLADVDLPHLIYIDPMHPARQKSALVKKDMQVLQQLMGPDEDALDLLRLAQTKALEHVVVKWPRHTPALLPPSASVFCKTVRFDIYP